MSEQSINNSPDLGQQFGRSAERGESEFHLEHDAANWEPTEEYDIEKPSELRYELHHTPGGTIEQEVHTEIDSAARTRILEALQERNGQHDLADEQELDFNENFNHASQRQSGGFRELSREFKSRERHHARDRSRNAEHGFEADR